MIKKIKKNENLYNIQCTNKKKERKWLLLD